MGDNPENSQNRRRKQKLKHNTICGHNNAQAKITNNVNKTCALLQTTVWYYVTMYIKIKERTLGLNQFNSFGCISIYNMTKLWIVVCVHFRHLIN
jgi:hypothetical protein